MQTVWIDLPDGTRLAGNLWRPEGVVPTILEALPYRRRDSTAARDLSYYPQLMERGFAGLRIDLRGTGDSGGLFDDEYSETELSDIEAVIHWIAAQPWSNGKVGMMGISWGGFNALQVAARAPEPLKAVISIASTVDRFADDIHYKGGAMLSANLSWATQMLGRAALPPDEAVVGEGWRASWLHRLESLEPLHFRWFEEQRRGPYWQRGSICEDFSALEARALLIAGWADGYRNTPWKGLAGLGEKARAITGPWVHLYPHFATPAPRLDFLAEAEAWFGRWLDDRPAEDLPAHRLYLSEAVRPEDRGHEPGRWIALGAALPLRQLYLSANGLHDAPQPEAQVQLKSPRDCGTSGGEFFTQGGIEDLPGDQRSDDGKSLCFDLPVAEAFDIIGQPVLRLPVAIDAPQGNLIARLCDVHPDGTSHRISLAVLNLSHRAGSAVPRAMIPGEAEDITLTLDATAYRLRPGHTLRLALSTHYFPMVLPPPTDVTATLSLGSAFLNLPQHAFTEIEVPEPEAQTLPQFARNPPASASRSVTRRLQETASTGVIIEASSGRVTHPVHNMEWMDARSGTWTVLDGDPLGMTAQESCRGERLRNGIHTELAATANLTVSPTHWQIEAQLQASEDGQLVFERTWSRAIPRDHV